MKWLKTLIFDTVEIEKKENEEEPILPKEKFDVSTIKTEETTIQTKTQVIENISSVEKEEPEVNSIRNIEKSKKGTINSKTHSIWLSEKQIAELYEKSLPTAHKHIANIYKEGELSKENTTKKVKTKVKEGSRELTREINFYSIEVIVAVGYRIGGQVGTDFRVWANKIVCDNYRKTGEIKM